MTAHHRDQQRAYRQLGLVGASLGVIAGVVQLMFGSSIPAWSGSKNSSIVLGALTIVLSLAAIAAAVRVPSRHQVDAERGTVAAAAFVVVGAVCFTTVGRLWYLPGTLLLAAGVFAVLASGAQAIGAVVAKHWLRMLVSVLGACEVLMAASASSNITAVIGVGGGLAVVFAPWLPSDRRRAIAIAMLLSIVPFAILTWWSIVTPTVAVLALAIGLATMRPRPGLARGSVPST